MVADQDLKEHLLGHSSRGGANRPGSKGLSSGHSSRGGASRPGSKGPSSGHSSRGGASRPGSKGPSSGHSSIGGAIQLPESQFKKSCYRHSYCRRKWNAMVADQDLKDHLQDIVQEEEQADLGPRDHLQDIVQ